MRHRRVLVPILVFALLLSATVGIIVWQNIAGETSSIPQKEYEYISCRKAYSNYLKVARASKIDEIYIYEFDERYEPAKIVRLSSQDPDLLQRWKEWFDSLELTPRYNTRPPVIYGASPKQIYVRIGSTVLNMGSCDGSERIYTGPDDYIGVEYNPDQELFNQLLLDTGYPQ